MNLITRRTLITAGAAALLTGPALAAPYKIPAKHRAKIARIKSSFKPGEIHVAPGQFALYFTMGDNKAMRYRVGLGVEGRYYSGTFRVARKAEWPRWPPTKAMILRDPGLYRKFAGGMAGGPKNPLGARALYLHSGNRDSLLRIHVTPGPKSVGTRVSNGCVRMINEHVIDLFDRVPNGTRVVLH